MGHEGLELEGCGGRGVGRKGRSGGVKENQKIFIFISLGKMMCSQL